MKKTFTISDNNGDYTATFTEVIAVRNSIKESGIYIESEKSSGILFSDGFIDKNEFGLPDDEITAAIYLIFHEIVKDEDILKTMEIIKEA